MCGITGLIAKKANKEKDSRIDRMTDVLYHRGPDGGATFQEQNIAFGHRRLSILDLSKSGNQPYLSPCGNYVLVFNGEIFNFKSFYEELRLKGYQFRSSSDTEVLLYLLMEYGIGVLRRLNGFFAFALWDKKGGKIHIARDRFGVKPLFFAENEEELLFASEPKAIFEAGFEKEIEEEHLPELFFYRYISGEHTIFKNVYRLLPGHFLEMDQFAANVQQVRWFHLGEESKKITIKEPLGWFENQFEESIRLRMISDVPVGTLLSGGLDSSSVLSTQYHLNYQEISAWNISFSNYKHDESSQAKRLAESYGMDFNSYEFVQDELLSLVSNAIIQNDEPIVHLQDGHLLGISKAAKKKVSVLLSGEGADEVLGGYVRYKVHDKPWRYQVLQLLRFVPSKYISQPRLKKMKRYLEVPNVDFQLMSNSNELFISDLKDLGMQDTPLLVPYRIRILEESKRYYPGNVYRQLLYLEQHTHLCTLNDRNDRTTMGASIECRDPFLDPDLVTGVASLSDSYFSSDGKGKFLLRNTIGRRLPNFILNHPKIGLSVPWDIYFTTHPQFREKLDSLHKNPLFEMGFFSRLEIKSIIDEFKKDTKKNYGLVRQLFFMALWYDLQFGKGKLENAAKLKS